MTLGVQMAGFSVYKGTFLEDSEPSRLFLLLGCGETPCFAVSEVKLCSWMVSPQL